MGFIPAPANVRATSGQLTIAAPSDANDSQQLTWDKATKRALWKAGAAGGGAAVIGISHVYFDTIASSGGPGASTASSYTLTFQSISTGGYSEAGAPPQIPLTFDNVASPGVLRITQAGLYSFRLKSKLVFSGSGTIPKQVRESLVRGTVYNSHEKFHSVFLGTDGVPPGTIAATEGGLWDDWTVDTQWVYANDTIYPRYQFNVPTAMVLNTGSCSGVLEITRLQA